MNELITWLRGVLDEDERVARDYPDSEDYDGAGIRAKLADIEAKRAILDAYELAEQHTVFGADDWRIGHADGLRDAVHLLASAHAHRDGYRDEWRPE